MKRNGRGFTLVEIMTVLAIVSLLTAVSIPNLLRARTNANEVAAQKALKTIGGALDSYYFAQTPHTFPASLDVLAASSPPYLTSQITDNTTAGEDVSGLSGYKGYVFRYQPDGQSGNRYHNYILAALPKTEGVSGERYFVLDSSGSILETTEENATAPTVSFGDADLDQDEQADAF